MRKFLHLGTWLGIPIKMHYSFVLTVALVAYIIISENLTSAQAIGFSGYMMSLFFCVLLHEYGHILMARRYGIDTQDVILSPIGGIARLKGFPDRPFAEIMVAIAGPLVNVVIVLIMIAVLKLLGAGVPNPEVIDYSTFANPIGFIYMVMLMNGVLCVFNLMPAFPMDGGRIFRAFLSFRYPKLKATFVASVIGRVLALSFVGVGLYIQTWVLAGIGVFIFWAAGREYAALRQSYTNADQISER